MFTRSLVHNFSKLVVYGGGSRGGGIAQVSAAHGIDVTIVETTPDLAKKCNQSVTDSLRRSAEQMAETNVLGHADYVERVTSKLTFVHEGVTAENAVQHADLIIEAIVEDLVLKQSLWSRLDKLAPPECVFATNTSTLSVHGQAEVTQRSNRFLGIHFLSPIVLMKLVEVVKMDSTSKEALESVMHYIQDIGKEAVVCRDTRGFIITRLLLPLILEAARMVERGDASMEDVDRAMKLGAGHPLGPFALCDSIGVDVVARLNKTWHQEAPEDTLFREVPLITQTALEGKGGKKCGEGFYKYTKK